MAQQLLGTAIPLLVRVVETAFGQGSGGPYKSKSKYVLDVLKSRENLKISLSWSCLSALPAAKFQSPGDLFVNVAASFVQCTPDWKSGHVCRLVQGPIRCRA